MRLLALSLSLGGLIGGAVVALLILVERSIEDERRSDTGVKR